MYCTQCGKFNSSTALVCLNCGFELNISKNEQNITSGKNDSQLKSDYQSFAKLENSEQHTTRVILITLLIFFTAIIGVRLLYKDVDSGPKGPSFDCTKATTATQKAICKDPTLSKLDLKNDDLYKKALQLSPDSTKQILYSLYPKRTKCNGDENCIRSNFQASIKKYEAIIQMGNSNTGNTPSVSLGNNFLLNICEISQRADDALIDSCNVSEAANKDIFTAQINIFKSNSLTTYQVTGSKCIEVARKYSSFMNNCVLKRIDNPANYQIENSNSILFTLIASSNQYCEIKKRYTKNSGQIFVEYLSISDACDTDQRLAFQSYQREGPRVINFRSY